VQQQQAVAAVGARLTVITHLATERRVKETKAVLVQEVRFPKAAAVVALDTQGTTAAPPEMAALGEPQTSPAVTAHMQAVAVVVRVARAVQAGAETR